MKNFLNILFDGLNKYLKDMDNAKGAEALFRFVGIFAAGMALFFVALFLCIAFPPLFLAGPIAFLVYLYKIGNQKVESKDSANG